MTARRTAILLIGFQHDYFSPDGILHAVIEESAQVTDSLANTLSLIRKLEASDALIIATPIRFTESYAELVDPVGILETIRRVGAFRADGPGGATIPELRAFGDRIVELPGKRGLNAFSNTELEAVLRHHDVDHVVIAGVVTSICVDSTGRSAHERGYRVTVLSDCTSGRTTFEQDFYCQEVFPLYARVTDHRTLVDELLSREAG